jgi:hypothetical protein
LEPTSTRQDDPDDDRLWKIGQIFDILNLKFSKLYHLTEHMAVDDVIIKFKEKVVFWQYIKKNIKRFGIKCINFVIDMATHMT